MPWKMAKKGGKVGEVRIYGLISELKWYEEDTSPSSFQNDLDEMGELDELFVYINSPGGGYYAGTTIYNILKRMNNTLVTTIVDGIAASSASIVLQAGDERKVCKNAEVFIHNPLYGLCGWFFAKDLRKYAEELDKSREGLLNTYDRAKVSTKKLQEMLDEETTLTAKEALKLGFVDSIEDYSVDVQVDNKKVTINGMSFDSRMFKNFDLSKIQQSVPPLSEPVQEPEPEPEAVDYTKTELSIYDAKIRYNSTRLCETVK